MSDTQEAATEQLRLGPPLIEITDLEVNFKARVGLIEQVVVIGVGA